MKKIHTLESYGPLHSGCWPYILFERPLGKYLVHREEARLTPLGTKSVSGTTAHRCAALSNSLLPLSELLLPE